MFALVDSLETVNGQRVQVMLKLGMDSKVPSTLGSLPRSVVEARVERPTGSAGAINPSSTDVCRGKTRVEGSTGSAGATHASSTNIHASSGSSKGVERDAKESELWRSRERSTSSHYIEVEDS